MDGIAPADLYERDFYAWTQDQAARLRAMAPRNDGLDPENLAEEVESLGRSDRRAAGSLIEAILLHLLKWDHQPERRTRSWATSIRTQRVEALQVLAENPSLKPRRAEALHVAYARARIEAAGETGLNESDFPGTCPYDLDAVMTRDIAWPPVGG